MKRTIKRQTQLNQQSTIDSGMEDGAETWKEDVREKSNDIEEVILEECVDGTISEDDLKHDDNESDVSKLDELIDEVAEESVKVDAEIDDTVNDDNFLDVITTPLQPSTIKIQKLTCIERPWDHPDDEENFCEIDYEFFCKAIRDFNKENLSEKTDEWISRIEHVLPTLCSSIRHYIDENFNEYEDGSVEMKLCDWAEFCLNEEMVFHESGIVNETHLHIGCRFTERLLLMRPRQLASALIQRRLMHRLLDLICSNKLSNSMRCQATNTLFASLFYWDVSVYAMFEQTKFDTHSTPYARIIQLLLHANELPIYVVLRLRSIVDYCAFMYWLFLIRNLSSPDAYHESDTEHSTKLLTSLMKTINFITEWPKTKTNPKCFMYRSLHDSEILRSLCLIVTSTKMRIDIRQCAVRLLKILIDFDGNDITGAVFLAHTRIEVASLVLRILDRCSNDGQKHDSDQSELQSKRGLLPYALHALQLINNLALTNQRGELDCEERISVLQQMLMLCTRWKGLKALTSALSYASSMEYLLEVFTLSTDATNDEPASDEAKVRMRQSASYGYACEILFTLARSQSNGSFWRTYGGFLCRLIDSSFISAATSLKQWTDPLRYTLSHASNASALHFLLQRLISYTNKFASGEPPFSVITVLRLINALLDEHYDDLKANQSERYYEIVTIFYDEGGLQQIIQLLKLANTMYSRSTTESRGSLKSDPSIYVSLVCSALRLIDKLHKSFISISKLLDISAVDVMVDTYALCGFGKTADHLHIRRVILANLALFITTTPASLSMSNSLKMAFTRLFHYGMSQPQTFLAVIDILRRLIPQPYIDTADCDEVFNQKQFKLLQTTRTSWTHHLLQFKPHLSFITSLGISSSRLLRSYLIALLVRLAHLGVNMARFIAETLLEQIISALSISSTSSVLKALENESDDEQLKSLINEEVRFGAATDYTTAAMIAFTLQCLRDKTICASFIDVVSNRSLFITTSLKFFNVASPKTVSHVIFQKYLIKMFIELCCLCRDDDPNERIPLLPHELFVTVCNALCEHIQQTEQSLDTVVPCMNALIAICENSKHARCIVERAFASKPGSLTRFIRRFESSTSDHSSDLLNTVGELLLKLFQNCFSKNAWLCVALRWPLAADEQNGDNCKEHPLLRFTMHLQQKSDYGCTSSSVISRLEDIIKILEKSSERNETEKEFAEEAWTAVDNITQQIEGSLIELSAFSKTAICDEITTTLCDTDFDPPMMAVDVKQIAQEFFPEGFLEQKTSDFPPLTKGYVRPRQLTSKHNSRATTWKSSGFGTLQRKRIISRGNTIRSSSQRNTVVKRRRM